MSTAARSPRACSRASCSATSAVRSPAPRGDIPALGGSLLPRAPRRCGRDVIPLSADALARMAGYGWPGNVRELENVLERALVLCEGTEITAADLELPDRPAPPEELMG